MKQLLIVTDPIGGATSVQLDFLLSLGHHLRRTYSVAVYTPHCGTRQREILRGAGFRLLVPDYSNYAINRILNHFGQSNESMLWAEGWFRETFFRWNQLDAEKALRCEQFDYVLNMSATVLVPCNVWWIQGMPLDETLRGMASTNLVARFADMGASSLVRWLDNELVDRMKRSSASIVTNSPFMKELYEARGVNVDGVVYGVKDFTSFQPPPDPPTRDYVLMYVGKETEPLDFPTLKEAGVRLVGFGSKIPAATRLRRFTDWIDFRGFVPQAQLAGLYANALFTMFPFTCEPLGYVPIESMACGTPVLTFDRQGPGATVVDGLTGWLVKTGEEMVHKAAELWQRRSTGISPDACVRRAQDFSVRRSASELQGWFERTTHA